MKTSLPGSSKDLDQHLRETNSASPSSVNVSGRVTGYDADDELTRRLQAELQETAQPPQPSRTTTGRPRPVRSRKQTGRQSASRGKRDPADRQESQPSNRRGDQLQKMAELAINAYSLTAPSTEGSNMHEVPGWYEDEAFDMEL
jgi:hypothetical protein